MASDYEVIPYSIDKLKQLLSELAEVPLSVIESKYHSTYFDHYFNELKPQIIVVEKEYIDHDYLEDYAGYYARCFKPYKRTCTRLHFFTQDFSEEDFKSLLQGFESSGVDDEKSKSITIVDLHNSYLGFIVVKPLPQTIFGRTCLQTYSEDGKDGIRYFPSLRKYEANLFGIPLDVDTLAFQEQDRVVSACATSALWTVFQGTGKLFQHSIPSPVEITKMAVKSQDEYSYLLYDREFPNEGLTIPQMTQAIKYLGLDPCTIAVEHNINYLKNALYAYLRGKIPILFTFSLYAPINNRNNSSIIRSDRVGNHAVAITGYQLSNTDPTPFWDIKLLLTASRINKIYVHDDQLGPFARMNFHDTKVTDNETNEEYDTLSTTWKNTRYNSDNMLAAPRFMLIPVYPKIRIPFKLILQIIIQFDQFFESRRSHAIIPLDHRIYWDIFLTTINDLKTDILSSSYYHGEDKRQFLTKSMPRFLWRTTAYSEKTPIFDLLFDATDIPQGDFLSFVIKYDEGIAVSLKGI